MSKFAWVTLATNDSYSLGALVVAYSLKRVHTAHQLAVLITPGVSEAMKTKLRSVFNIVQEVNLLDSKDEANLALLKRPELGITFTKLHCWRLTQFEKCVFLDADTLVLRNCDELFEREELSAAPDVGWPDCFNSGVYVYRPSMETFASLMQFAVTNGSFDGGDQGLLNSYFADWAHTDIAKHLPFVYNTSSVASYSYLPAFKQFGQNTKILHFIGTAKPWLQNFNSETRKVYIPTGYQHLANFLQYWWDIFCEDVHSRLSSEMNTEQWVEHVHRHDQGGHWAPEPPPVVRQPESVQQDAGGGGGGGGGGESHHHHHEHHQQQQHHYGGDSSHHEVKHEHGGGDQHQQQQHQHGGGDQHQQQQHQHQQQQHQEQQHHDQPAQGDGSGLAGALSQLHLGEPKSAEQEAYEEHMRRQCWESGNIDYMGRDAFDNIWKKIEMTLSVGPDPVPAVASSSEPVRAISPAPLRFRSSKSRSRSITPKRDPRDRSPTPQPEDSVPVEKKEGYQQVITTKSPEGKTHTKTKTIYDPSVDDDESGFDAVDAPRKVTAATAIEAVAPVAVVASAKVIAPIVERATKPVKPLEPEVKPKPVPQQKATPPPRQEETSPPPKVPPQPQVQQQLAQETMAGKKPTVEPVRSFRRKRLSSPQATPPTTPPPTAQLPSLPPPKTVPPKTATVPKASPSAKPSKPATTMPVLPSKPPSSATNHKSLPPPSLPSRQETTKTVDQIETAPLTANDELAAQQQTQPTPPIPPRRKRESKTSRIGKTKK